MKITRLLISIVLLVFSSWAVSAQVNMSDLGKSSVKTVGNKSQVKYKNNFTVNHTTWASSVTYTAAGVFDLTPYKSMSFTVTNHDAKMPLNLFTLLWDTRLTTVRQMISAKGAYSYCMSIAPGETRYVEILFQKSYNEEVYNDFSLMRCAPFSYNGYSSYFIDYANVKVVKFLAPKAAAGMKYSINDIQFHKGEKKDFIKTANMSHSDFFPFIDKYGQFKHREWPGKVKSDADLQKAKKAEEKDLKKNPGAKGWSKYGGWLNGPRREATGHFRVEKIDGKWWMVDPEGYLFWSHGVVRVTPSSGVTPLAKREFYFEELPEKGTAMAKFYETHDDLLWPYYVDRKVDYTYDFSCANIFRKYGEDYESIWADLAHKRLRSWGLNTIANSSDIDICKMDRTVYTDRVEVYSKPLEGARKGWWPFRDPFDPSFKVATEEALLAKKALLDDPWCLGMFVDNEITWGSRSQLGEITSIAPPDQAAKIAMKEWLEKKYGTIEELNKAWGTKWYTWQGFLNNRKKLSSKALNDQTEFTDEIVREYFKNVREVFKKVAPHKLYMGCRFAGFNEYILAIAAEYCDVMSYNIYAMNLDNIGIRAKFDIPIMIGEFHFGSQDRGKFHSGLIYAENQKDRAQYYYNYVKSALEHPLIIGTHWHQFSDQPTTGRFDGENFQVGFTDICDTPYPETVEMVRKVGYDMYNIRSSAK